MKTLNVISLIPVVLLALLMIEVTAVSAVDHSASFDVLASAASKSDKIPVIMFLDNRLTMDDVYPIARDLPMSERRVYVVKTLKTRFAESGSLLMSRLEEAKKQGRVGILRPLWIVNAIRMTAEVDLISEIEKTFPNVVYIVGDPAHDNTLDNGWGINNIQAPRVWTGLGVDGSGVIVGHKDAGLDIHHPGFQGHLWLNPGEDLNHNGVLDAPEVNEVDDDGNGYIDDFNGWCFDDDDNDVTDAPLSGNHGTRTGSIISSGFSPCDTVCVAPGAKLMELSAWISQGAIWEASQYAVEMGASVISSSVSNKLVDCGSTYRDCPNFVVHRFVSEMELAAGLIHANSTGNDTLGPPRDPLPAPSNCPPPILTASHPVHGGVSSIVSVAGYVSGGGLFVRSGRGPAGWSRGDICINPRMPFCAPDGYANQYPPQFNDYPYLGGTQPGLAKPDCAAPTDVAALYPDVGSPCSTISGTSGATPHVGGVLALIYSAYPGITPEEAYLRLVQGCTDAGAVGFDNLWGFGKIRPFPACSSGTGTLAHVSGVITEMNGGTAIAGVRVWADSTNSVTTGSDGAYELWFTPGERTIYIRKNGYQEFQFTVTLAAGQSAVRNVVLSVAETTVLLVNVTGDGIPLTGMPVSLSDISLDTVTDNHGQVSVTIYSGTHTFQAGALPWNEVTGSFVAVDDSMELLINLNLSPRAAPTGPDPHGYYIYDNYDIPQAAFDWVEINPALGRPGTNLNLGTNTSVVQLLPFSFRYYGQNYTAITISSNGFIVMGSNPSSEWGALPIPNSTAPNNLIAPLFDRWNGGQVFFYSNPDSHRVIVEWYLLPEFSNTCTATFQVILYDPLFVTSPSGDGVIRFQYNYLDRYSEGAIGIENADGTAGLEYLFQTQLDPHAAPIVAGRSLLFTTAQLSSSDDPIAEFPSEFVLEPNYPNPFNPSTTFAWTLPKSSMVKLALYNLLGQQVAVIAEGFATAGRYEKNFNAESLTSGLYFAKLESDGRIYGVQKVVLLK